MGDYNMGKLSCQWTRLKRANVKLAHAMRRAGDKRWGTVLQCAREATVRYCPACGRAHAQGTNCCRHRLCPICQVRRSRKLAHQAIAAAQWLAAEGRLDGVRMGLVTLTQRNVPADLLPGMIDSMLAALTRMRHQRAVRRYMIGSARNIEITYNQQAGTYHPHVHLIVMLAPGAPDEMLTSAYWRDLWGDLMQLDYAPICDARELHDRDKAVCEVSKYVCKALEILEGLSDDLLPQVVAALNAALTGRRLVAYTGIWAEARRVLKQRDDDDASDSDDQDICGCGAALADAVMIWDGNEYRLK